MENLNHLVKLHPEAKEISFKHKFFIQHGLKKGVIGTLGIDYFSLMIIDENNTLTIYSSCPALEYNIIHQDLWQHDGIFELKNHEDGSFFFWDQLYSSTQKRILLTEKERKFGFQFGFFIMKRVNNLFVIYSFATKHQEDKETYLNSRDILTKIGDYAFVALEKVHKNYIIQPTNDVPRMQYNKLKLVVNNKIKGIS